MENKKIIPTLQELIKSGRADEIESYLDAIHPVLIAENITELSIDDIKEILIGIPVLHCVEILRNLDIELQVELISKINRRNAAKILTEMPPDDRADLFGKISEDQRELIMPALAQVEREDIRRLTSYKDGTAGAVMTSEYSTLAPSLTITEAIAELRKIAPDKETIYYAYIIDEKRKLIGFVSLKDLILARPHQTVEEIMNREVIFAHVNDDQEDAARKIQKYDLIALPIVNGGNSLMGILTHDDAIDIITQEHTEDMEKLMAIGGTHEVGIYLKTPALIHFKNRVFWIIALSLLGFISGMIIHSFESVLLQLMLLALYMPMLADTGGNTGSQAATVIVRALALKEIFPKDFFKIIFKELKIALLISIVVGLITWAKVIFLSQNVDIPENLTLYRIAIVITMALCIQVITSTLMGAILPLLASRFKLDPAVVASPALTTLVDITGLVIYFTLAKMLLGI